MNRKKCYIIAEAGLNHNGSMKLAKQLIDIASDAKADAVKFQKRNVSTLATEKILDTEDNRFPSLGSTYREIRQSLEFTKEQYKELKSYTERKGLDFICTAFDIESVDFLEDIAIECYKLASHSITNLPLLDYVASKGKKIILSTGMCTLEEVDRTVSILQQNNNTLIILHCVSSYPHSAEESNLSLMEVYRERYGLEIGYSGHELGYKVTLAAVAAGAVVIEKHFTSDKSLEGFDHKLSLNPEELTSMIDEIRTIEKCFGTGKKFISDTEQITRDKYHVSMVSIRAINKGEVITKNMITYKNPGTGLQPKDAAKVLGKTALEDIPCDDLIDISKVVISALDESGTTARPHRETETQTDLITAICPVLRTFNRAQMDNLISDIKAICPTENIYIVSELEEVDVYCQEKGYCFITRPTELMPSTSTIEDVLKFSAREIEKRDKLTDLIVYCNYEFSTRPQKLFTNLINEIQSKKLDTVFPSTEIFSNIWKTNSSGEYTMIGDWLPHEKRDPMYISINGLGTITKSSFIKQGKLIGNKVGIISTHDFFSKSLI